MSPHEHISPHALPIRNENKTKVLLISFIFSSFFTLFFALILKLSGITINIILPSSAPIWMGILTVSYMFQS